MGICNSSSEKDNKPRKINVKKNCNQSSSTKVSESNKDKDDYILSSQLAIHSPLSNKYTISSEYIGKGASGVVSEAFDKFNQRYAIKTINKLSVKFIEVLVKEVEISMSLNHPHIIKYYEVYEDLKTVSVVMDLAEGGDLFDFILKGDGGRLDDDTSLNLIIQILETIDYLHNTKKVCHRDIKPENFLITINNSEPNIKLIDFGFATYLDGTLMNDFLGTQQYTAPEILNRELYSEKVDIWSVGVLLFNMITGCQPFTTDSNIPIEEQILSKEIPFEAIENEGLQKLCRGLLERNPEKRFDAKKALDTAVELRDRTKKVQLRLEEDDLYNNETKKGTFDFIPFGQVNTCITGPNIKF